MVYHDFTKLYYCFSNVLSPKPTLPGVKIATGMVFECYNVLVISTKASKCYVEITYPCAKDFFLSASHAYALRSNQHVNLFCTL